MKSIEKMKLLRLVPISVITIIIFSTWWTLVSNRYSPFSKHYAALIVFIVNIILYFVRFRWGLLFTGIMLILATFNLISFFYEVSSNSFGIGIGDKTLNFPPMQGYSFLLLALYSIINFNFLMNEYKKLKKGE